MNIKLRPLRALCASFLAMALIGESGIAQGTTTPASVPIPPGATLLLSQYMAAGGQTQAAIDMVPPIPYLPTMVVEFGIPGKGAKAESGFDGGVFVVIIPHGTTVGDAVGLVFHELSHAINMDPPLPKPPTADDMTSMFCREARSNCDALAAIAIAHANEAEIHCAAVRRLQADAYYFWRNCQLGVGVLGPVSSTPCPQVQSGSVPCL